MKMTDLRAKARAIFGPAIAEPMPKQPNGAKALQQRANARPIPTYKVGGVVKKPMPAASAASGNRMAKQEADEMRFMDMMDKKKKSAMPSPAASAASGNRMAREEGAEMRKMKMAKGGKAGKYADGGMAEELLVEGRRPQTVNFDLNRMQGSTGGRMGPPAPSSGGGGRGAPVTVEAPAPAARGRMPIARTSGYTGPTADVAGGRMTAGVGPSVGGSRRVGIGYSRPFKDGGKVQTSSDTARKLASEMGGMKKGGKVKPVELDMKMLEEMSRPKMSLPKADLETKAMEARNLNAVRAKETSDAAKSKSFKEAFAEARRDQGSNGVFTWRGNTYNTKMAGESSKGAPARAAAPASTRAAAPPPAAAAAPPPATAGAPPAAGAATQPTRKAAATTAAAAPVKPRVGLRNTEYGSALADILDKEGAANAASNKKLIERYRSEGRPRLAKIVSMLSGAEYAKGGKVKAEKAKEAKPKNGLAVMIAIGSPKKPAKKMDGEPMGYAAGGAGKTRKDQAPIKKAQGGAAKVRKGMMSPEGNIINAMNKMRGK